MVIYNLVLANSSPFLLQDLEVETAWGFEASTFDKPFG
jgi:hypothetical protein